jgi:hypothetical protein
MLVQGKGARIDTTHPERPAVGANNCLLEFRGINQSVQPRKGSGLKVIDGLADFSEIRPVQVAKARHCVCGWYILVSY